MKCIHCQTDTKYAERTDGKCPKCQRAFAFEPTKGDKLTDPAFQALIERVSSGGTVQWTDRHLYYEVLRRTQRRSKAAPWVLGSLALLGAVLGALSSGFFFFPVAVLLLMLILLLPSKIAGLSFEAFDLLFQRWLRAHGQPQGLIVRKGAEQPTPASRSLPSDIQHYSFDRAVVTDRPETVDLLLANNFHFENNCAVLTADGYPERAFDVVRGMLRNNPKLAVYVLHDATLEGCNLAQRLATSGWFQPTARIVDVGLGPEHARAFKGCWQAAENLTPPASAAAGKLRWLSRYSLELAVVRPEQIIKRLFRALSNASDLQADEGGAYFIDSGAFSSDASASDGGGDSFG